LRLDEQDYQLEFALELAFEELPPLVVFEEELVLERVLFAALPLNQASEG
jgi:hypothetical protein